MIISPNLKIIGNPRNIGKAVQLYIGEIPILAIGELEPFHGELLDKVLAEEKILFERRILNDGTAYAQLEGKGYRVVGMGMADLWEISQKIINLSGESSGYEIGIDKEHAEKIGKLLKFEIKVSDNDKL